MNVNLLSFNQGFGSVTFQLPDPDLLDTDLPKNAAYTYESTMETSESSSICILTYL